MPNYTRFFSTVHKPVSSAFTIIRNVVPGGFGPAFLARLAQQSNMLTTIDKTVILEHQPQHLAYARRLQAQSNDIGLKTTIVDSNIDSMISVLGEQMRKGAIFSLSINDMNLANETTDEQEKHVYNTLQYLQVLALTEYYPARHIWVSKPHEHFQSLDIACGYARAGQDILDNCHTPIQLVAPMAIFLDEYRELWTGNSKMTSLMAEDKGTITGHSPDSFVGVLANYLRIDPPTQRILPITLREDATRGEEAIITDFVRQLQCPIQCQQAYNASGPTLR